MKHPTLLVFVELPDPTFPTDGFLKYLAYPDTELVGFYNLDSGESVQAAQDRYEERFDAELQAQAERFEQHGLRTDCDLVFDHDRVEARHRIARSGAADAVLLPGGADTLGKVMIAARHARNADERIANLLNIVDRESLVSLDLIHIADPDDPEAEAEGERVLAEMASLITEQGVSSVQVNQEVRTGEDVAFRLNQAARDSDLLVLGETEQDISDRIFGPVAEYIVDDRDVPVLIAR